jgi:hypothetical protein
VADGVGGNAILAALTDAAREGEPLPPPPEKAPGGWAEKSFSDIFERAMRDRVAQDAARARAVGRALWRTARAPGSLLHLGRVLSELARDFGRQSESPLREFGRARRLAGIEVDLERVRAAKQALGGSIVDVVLTAVAGALGAWHGAHRLGAVAELKPTEAPSLVRLPLGIADPSERFREIHRRVEERKAHPAVALLPLLANVMARLPRTLYRAVAYRRSQAIDLIVTNVPGVPVVRHLAGAEILAAYPFAPVTSHCPVSIACYGYRDRLYVGLDTDATSLPDIDEFRRLLIGSFEETICAAALPPG